MDVEYVKITGADDVTQEIMDLAESIESGWFGDQRIDWSDFIDRIDGQALEDGRIIDMGSDLNSPAIRKIRHHINTMRKG